MLVSGGKVIAIDNIKTNSATLSGDGIWSELGLNTSATIDPIKNDISSLSSTITNISGDLYNLSGDVYNISSNVNIISGDLDTLKTEVSTISSELDKTKFAVDTISGNVESLSSEVTALSADVETISSDLINTNERIDSLEDNVETLSSTVDEHTEQIEELFGDVNYISAELDKETSARCADVSAIEVYINKLSADLDDEIYYREKNDNYLSAAIDENRDNIFIVSSYADSISAGLDEETEARLYDIDVLEGKVEALSSYLDEETLERYEVDEYLSAAIDTKQRQLSAGDNILITSGDEYDTISVTGLKTTTYFATPFNKHTYSEYFDFNVNKLSANSAVGYFNLSIGYKVNTNGTNVDNYYYACVKVNDEIVDTHYINGGIPSENHYISKNILNDSEDNLYTITIEKDNGINISDMNITCVGYIGETDPISLGVLGANSGILTFGNTILRV